jgi:hypothetical protein
VVVVFFNDVVVVVVYVFSGLLLAFTIGALSFLM